MCAVRCDMSVRTVHLKCFRALHLKESVRTKSEDVRREKFRMLKHIGTPIRVP